MQKNGKSENTLTDVVRNLKRIARQCNLNNPEEVKLTIAKANIKNVTKLKLVNQYTSYIKYKGLKWDKPKYTQEEKIPFIPTETEIDQLTASCGRKLSTILQILKETGMRIGEAHKLKWIDINLENKTINITPEKGSNPRILPISNKLIAMLNRYPKTREHILPKRINSIRSCFDYQRIRTAEKLQNPRLKKISFHTLRHWKGTTEYHKTKDIMHVKYVLGHKEIKATLLYINIEQATFLADTDDWTCKIAHNETEEQQLIEANFTFVNKREEPYTAFYKKRK
jgi:integrase